MKQSQDHPSAYTGQIFLIYAASIMFILGYIFIPRMHGLQIPVASNEVQAQELRRVLRLKAVSPTYKYLNMQIVLLSGEVLPIISHSNFT